VKKLNKFYPQSVLGGNLDPNSGAVLLGSASDDRRESRARASHKEIIDRLTSLENKVDKLLKALKEKP
jgi:hypothetical protein